MAANKQKTYLEALNDALNELNYSVAYHISQLDKARSGPMIRTHAEMLNTARTARDIVEDRLKRYMKELESVHDLG